MENSEKEILYKCGIIRYGSMVYGADLSSLAGKSVKFRFYLTNGQSYSFWVSPDLTGTSDGYVAAGGPGFSTAIDTV